MDPGMEELLGKDSGRISGLTWDFGPNSIEYNELSSTGPDGEKIEEIGSGAESRVWKVWWYDDVVALKRMKLKVQREEDVAKFAEEAFTMLGCDHINVVKFHGFIPTPQALFFVYDFANAGCLRDLLETLDDGGSFEEFMGTTASAGAALEEGTLSLAHATRYALQLAEGVNYLHNEFTHQLIHRDIKSPNIMLHKQVDDPASGGAATLTMKLGDFGSARRTVTGSLNLSQKGTARWMAPEMLQTHRAPDGACSLQYDQHCDVWSLGMVFYELLTSKVPYNTIGEEVTIILWIGMNKLVPGAAEFPKPPDHTPPWFADMMMACWAVEPAKRPGAQDLVDILTKNLAPAAGDGAAAAAADGKAEDVGAINLAGLTLDPGYAEGKRRSSMESEGTAPPTPTPSDTPTARLSSDVVVATDLDEDNGDTPGRERSGTLTRLSFGDTALRQIGEHGDEAARDDSTDTVQGDNDQ